MRSGLELPTRQMPALDEREQCARHVGADLTNLLGQLPTPDLLLDQELLQDLRWHVAEALRLNTVYRRRLCDRLAGATPGQSHHESLHDPPDACLSRSSPP